MDYTANYQLPVWAETDRILRTDFNNAFGAIDTALEGKGNCQIIYGSYQANNKYGSTNANTLAFPGKPLLVMILDDVRGGHMVMTSGSKCAFLSYFHYEITYHVSVEWPTPNTVKWWSNSALNQANDGVTYHYVAFIAADDADEIA